MVAKLRLISRRIRWSLLIKAFVFGLAWLMLPSWAFFALALYLYLFPLFQPLTFALPFAMLMFFSFLTPPHGAFAVFLSVIFFIMLGMKELIFVNRIFAYEILTLLLIFFGFVKFFERAGGWGGLLSFVFAGFSAFLFFMLVRNLMNYAVRNGSAVRLPPFFIGIASFLVLQTSWALLFLPFTPLAQAALLFLGSALLIEILLGYAKEKLDRRKLIIETTSFFIVAGIIALIADWGL